MRVDLRLGDARETVAALPANSVQSVVTSPPYFGLRDYGVSGQMGLEATPADYVEALVAVFREVRRALCRDGTVWLNIGDSYNAYNGNRGVSRTGFSRNDPLPVLPKGAGLTVKTLPAKSLLGIPWRVAFGLQDDGWILRNAVIWNKPNAMPESVSDRLACRYENLFLFSKSTRYYFDLDAVREPHKRTWTPGRNGGRRDGDGQSFDRGDHLNTGLAQAAPHPKGKNPGDVWSIPTKPYRGAHFAVMPTELASRCVVTSCIADGTVLDPFCGSGTTGVAAVQNHRNFIGVDLNAEYIGLAQKRIGEVNE